MTADTPPRTGATRFQCRPTSKPLWAMKKGALRRRHAMGRPGIVLKAGAIEMVPEQWIVSVEGAPIHLTEKEYLLLQALLEVKGRVLSRESLLERIWGHNKAFRLETRTVDVHMRCLQKLPADSDRPARRPVKRIHKTL